MTGVISVVPARAQPKRRSRGTAAMAAVGAVLLVGGAGLVLQAAGPFRGAADLSASAAPLAGPTTLVVKTNVRSLARVLPEVSAAPASARPAGIDLVSMISPAAPPVSTEAHADPAPPARSLTLSVPNGVRIKSPTSFALGDTVYRLSDTVAVGVDACSVRRIGHCYSRPRRDFKAAIAGATLLCRPLGTKDGETLVDCIKAGAKGAVAKGRDGKDRDDKERDAKL